MWVFAVCADLITSLQPKLSFYHPLYQVPNQQRGGLELRELQGGPGRAWGHSRKRRLAQAVLLVGMSHLSSEEPVLPPLILMMARRVSKSPLSLSCGLQVLTSWSLMGNVQGNRARPLGCTREGPSWGTASPALWWEAKSTGLEAGT